MPKRSDGEWRPALASTFSLPGGPCDLSGAIAGAAAMPAPARGHTEGGGAPAQLVLTSCLMKHA